MPSGLSDTVANETLDAVIASVLPATMYLDGLTTAPSDDNGGDEVSWGQGRLAVTAADDWTDADGRLKQSVVLTLPANSSGDTITLVALGWYDALTSGTYLGGGPVDGETLDVPDGNAPTVTAILASPPPS